MLNKLNYYKYLSPLMRKQIKLLLICLIFNLPVFSQLNFKPAFQHIPPEKFGIDRVYAQCFAPDGSLWAASEDGLLHYNGYSTKHYRHIKGDTNSVLSNIIFTVFLSNTGDFYIVYGDVPGFSKYNPKKEKFTHYQFNPKNIKNSMPEVQIVNFKEDEKGIIWILTWGKGLIKFNPINETFKVYEYNADNIDNPKNIPCNQIKAFVPYKNGKYLLGFFGDGGNFSWPVIFDPKTETFEKFPIEPYLKNCEEHEANIIRSNLRIVHFIHIDRNDNIWIGTYSGLVFFETHFKKAFRVSGRKINASMRNVENTRSIIEDDLGRLWVASAISGLMVFDPNRPGEPATIKMELNNATALQDNRISTMAKDSDGNLWISTGHGGFSIYNPLVQQFNIIPWDDVGLEYSDASSQRIPLKDFHVDKKGLVYLAHEKGIYVVNADTKTVVEVIEPKKDDGYGDNDLLKYRVEGFKITTDKIFISQFGKIEIYDREKKKITSTVGGEKVAEVLFRNNENYFPPLFRGGLWNTLFTYDDVNNKAVKGFFFPDTITVTPSFGTILKNGKYFFSSGSDGFTLYDPQTNKWDRFGSKRNKTKYFPDSTINTYCLDHNGTVWVCTENGIYSFNDKTGKTEYMNEKFGLKYKEPVAAMIIDKKGIYWIALSKELVRYEPSTGESFKISRDLGMNPGLFMPMQPEMDARGRIYFVTIKGILTIDPSRVAIPRREPEVFLSGLIVHEDTLSIAELTRFSNGNYQLNWDQNFLNFEFHTDMLYSPSPHKFKYRLIGLDTSWIDNGNSNIVRYTNLSHGKYVLEVLVSNVYMTQSKLLTIPFSIKRPFWYTWWFLTLLALIAIGCFYAYVRIREKVILKKQEILEQKIAERTAEVVTKAQEIQHQRDVIEVKNKELTDSIHYAQRIQQSILPDAEMIKKYLPQHFIYFKPKDIVSGDFYWYSRQGDMVLWAVVDCTGHGVPGGFMSMLGSGLLNQIVNEEKRTEPSEILNHLRDRVIIALKQTGADGESRDGMDISLCSYNIKSNKLKYAGANLGAYILRNGELSELKGNKQPIGIHVGEKLPFTTSEILLEKNDYVYLTSDGYADQFGGGKGKKFKSSNFEKLLVMICSKTINDQYQEIDHVFNEWKGDFEQLDDVCVIGVKF
jgi:serine phosphatase RsbU (regulator of sigma subunit)/streptogramin lyase